MYDRKGLAFGHPPVGKQKIVSSPFEPRPIADPRQGLAANQDLTWAGKVLSDSEPINDRSGEHLENLEVWISNQKSACKARGHHQSYWPIGIYQHFRGGCYRAENSVLTCKPAGNCVTGEADHATAMAINHPNRHFEQDSQLSTQVLSPQPGAVLVHETIG
jgi:hypothetical protein